MSLMKTERPRMPDNAIYIDQIQNLDREREAIPVSLFLYLLSLVLQLTKSQILSAGSNIKMLPLQKDPRLL